MTTAAPAEVTKNVAPIPPGHEVIRYTKLVSVSFVTAIPALASAFTASIGLNGVFAIFPARLEPDGGVSPIEKGQQTTGLAIQWKFHDRIQRKDIIGQCFVAWPNIAGVQYGAP